MDIPAFIKKRPLAGGRLDDEPAPSLPLDPESPYSPDRLPQMQFLVDVFRESPFRAAPERADELKQIVDNLDIMVRFDERAEDWMFEALPRMGNRIKIGTRTFERLWAMSYGYSTLITEMQKAGSASFKDIPNQAEYLAALSLIRWARQSERDEIEDPWPADLPDPRDAGSLEHGHTATQLFLMCAGRILLHEIAHLVFAQEQRVFTSSIEEELAADAWADAWMLGRWRDYKADQNVFIVRSLGIINCHIPAFVIAFAPKEASLTHPTPVERVRAFSAAYMTGARPCERRHIDFPLAWLWLVILEILSHHKVPVTYPPDDADYDAVLAHYASHFTADANAPSHASE